MNVFSKVQNEEKGNVNVSVVISIVVFVMIMLPILTLGIERYRINIIRNDTSTAVEISLLSSLTALDIYEASSEAYNFESDEFISTFTHYLSLNMRLNPDLTDTERSLVDGDVTINEIRYVGTDNLPYMNPNTGEVFVRPYFNIELNLIISPSIYRKMILDVSGVDGFHYTFFDDVSMPIDN